MMTTTVAEKSCRLPGHYLLELADRLGSESAEATAPLTATASLALGLADRLDLLPALPRAFCGGGLLEAGALPARALGLSHQRSPPEQIALTGGEMRYAFAFEMTQ